MTHQPVEARIHGRKLANPNGQKQTDQLTHPVSNWREAIQPTVDCVHSLIAEVNNAEVNNDGSASLKQQAQEYLLSTIDKVIETRRKFHEENTQPDSLIQDVNHTGSIHARRTQPSGLWTAEQANEEDQAAMALLTSQLVQDLEDRPALREEVRQALVRITERDRTTAGNRR